MAKHIDTQKKLNRFVSVDEVICEVELLPFSSFVPNGVHPLAILKIWHETKDGLRMVNVGKHKREMRQK